MKNLVKIVLCCLSCLLVNFASAQNNYRIEPEKYDKALAAWEANKAKYGNDYEFTLVFASWTGYTYSTTITVKDGKVVKRAFKEDFMYEKDKDRKVRKWVEEGSEIGTNAGGERAITMDDIYREAKNSVSKDNSSEVSGETLDGEILTMKKPIIYFGANEEGAIQAYGYRHEDCVDDCYNGYRIREFKWLNAATDGARNRKKAK